MIYTRHYVYASGLCVLPMDVDPCVLSIHCLSRGIYMYGDHDAGICIALVACGKCNVQCICRKL